MAVEGVAELVVELFSPSVFSVRMKKKHALPLRRIVEQQAVGAVGAE